jgi:hypothetical protein
MMWSYSNNPWRVPVSQLRKSEVVRNGYTRNATSGTDQRVSKSRVDLSTLTIEIIVLLGLPENWRSIGIERIIAGCWRNRHDTTEIRYRGARRRMMNQLRAFVTLSSLDADCYQCNQWWLLAVHGGKQEIGAQCPTCWNIWTLLAVIIWAHLIASSTLINVGSGSIKLRVLGAGQ